MGKLLSTLYTADFDALVNSADMEVQGGPVRKCHVTPQTAKPLALLMVNSVVLLQLILVLEKFSAVFTIPIQVDS